MKKNKSRTGTGQYIPNFDDPRIVKRIEKALGWTLGCVRDEPREMSKGWIDANLGQQQNALGAWLRAKLLVCRDSRYFFGGDTSKCKEYSLNQAGWDEVSGMLLGIEEASEAKPMQCEGDGEKLQGMELVHAWARQSYKDELETKEFQYEEKESARLWHPLQNMTKEAKAHIWKHEGLGFNYDIKACAPTLIMQHAQHLGFDEWLEGMKDFLSDPGAYRRRIAEVAGYNYDNKDQAKKIKSLINAMFCGAKLGANKDFALFQLLDEDRNVVKKLQNDAHLMLLKDDIRRCWQVIETSMTTVRNANGRKLALSSKQKWNRYFDLERTVLNAVRKYLIGVGAKFFLEHDGWRTDKEIDIEVVQAYVLAETGFQIEISVG